MSSKYTIELRNIVESTNLDLFDFDYDFYSDNIGLRTKFEEQFIETYYFHEIGYETIDRFKWNLKARLNLIMPKYKEIYKTMVRVEDIDFMLNKDYTETYRKENVGVKNTSSNFKNVDKNESNNKNNDETIGKESSLADGISFAKLEDDYTTTVNKTENASISNNTSNGESSGENNYNEDGKYVEEFTLTGKGNIGITSASDLVKGWREVIVNINKDLIDELYDMFMLIY